VDGHAQFETECIGFFGDVVQVLGVPRSVGMIYGLLFASPTPLRFTDIADRLDISRGSASQGLHTLRTLGAVRALPNGSPHRELFEPELGLRTLVGGVLREKVDPLVKGGGTRVRLMRAVADSANDAGKKKFYGARVKQIETWRRQMGLLLPILTTILGSRRSG
jgi:DNA-binding transcriptional regulator GbsR (MarR family)